MALRRAGAVQTGQQLDRKVRALTQQVQDRSTDVAERLGPARVGTEQHEVRHPIGSTGCARQRYWPRPRRGEERSRFTEMLQHGLELVGGGLDTEIVHRAPRQSRAAPVVGDRTVRTREVFDQRRPGIGALGDHLEVGEPRRDRRSPGTRLRARPKPDRSPPPSRVAATTRRWTASRHRVPVSRGNRLDARLHVSTTIDASNRRSRGEGCETQLFAEMSVGTPGTRRSASASCPVAAEARIKIACA